MAVAATPPTGVTNAALVRWAFETITAHDVGALRQLWTAATTESIPSATLHGSDAMAGYSRGCSRRSPTSTYAWSSSPRRATTSSYTGR